MLNYHINEVFLYGLNANIKIDAKFNKPKQKILNLLCCESPFIKKVIKGIIKYLGSSKVAGTRTRLLQKIHQKNVKFKLSQQYNIEKA